MPDHAIMYTDGGSRGNPGPGAGAFVLYDKTRTLIGGKGFFLDGITNNYAEYTGMLEGLRWARELGIKTIDVYSDSELMVKQLNGIYKVKSPNLKELYAQCMDLLLEFSGWKVTHVYRESNKDADALANRAMDMRKNVVLAGKAKKKQGKKLRIGILLSGGGRTMENIQQEISAGALNAEIVTVVSSRSSVKGIERAKNIGVEPKIIRKKDYDNIARFSAAITYELEEAKVDLVVQAGWLCLWTIPPNYKNRVMNIHPALLPSFGGQGMWGHHVHEAVLKAGCKVSGCTVHFCTNEYDEGPIIIQRTCPVKDDDTPDTLAARVFEQECLAYPQAIVLFANGKIKVINSTVKCKA